MKLYVGIVLAFLVVGFIIRGTFRYIKKRDNPSSDYIVALACFIIEIVILT